MKLLGTELAATTYEALTQACHQLAKEPGCHAVEFANTQVVTMARHEPEFAELISSFDVVVPDGMPLVWCMNARGAGLKDRVYGPTFMRYCLEHTTPETTHYLLGGFDEAGRRLRERFPQANFVGSYHGKASEAGELEHDARVFEELEALKPDFIWVGLGTPRQQAFIRRAKGRLSHGVLLSVGFAFDVNAGLKPDAPAVLQRLGMTWLYRMASEPKRLGPRYLKWNSLFLYYLAREGLR